MTLRPGMLQTTVQQAWTLRTTVPWTRMLATAKRTPMPARLA
jgi:hypothetical protein